MNQSERLHNQGNLEQQNITPELKLSIQLRSTCEKLLEEKGQNRINLRELTMQVLQPFGIIRVLATRTMPQNLVRGRTLDLKELKGEAESKPDVTIACNGTNPTKAKVIGVYAQGMQDRVHTFAGTSILSLERQQRGKICDRYPLNYRFFDQNAPKQSEERLATMEDLEAYQKYIDQSLPVEHK